MSRWVGVVQHNPITGDRIGETLINLDNVISISIAENLVVFNSGYIKVNDDSIEHLIEIIETE